MCEARSRIFSRNFIKNFRLMSLVCRKKLSIYVLSKSIIEISKITVYLKHPIVLKKFRQKIKKSEIDLKQKPPKAEIFRTFFKSRSNKSLKVSLIVLFT